MIMIHILIHLNKQATLYVLSFTSKYDLHDSQACLDNHVLALASGQGTKYKVNTWRSGMWNVNLTLPSNVLCDKCMLQWKYHVG